MSNSLPQPRAAFLESSSNPLVAIALGLQPKARVIRRHRILYEGKTPDALATS
jgi:hypothetical protein